MSRHDAACTVLKPWAALFGGRRPGAPNSTNWEPSPYCAPLVARPVCRQLPRLAERFSDSLTTCHTVPCAIAYLLIPLKCRVCELARGVGQRTLAPGLKAFAKERQ
jgi:hypothetical protein